MPRADAAVIHPTEAVAPSLSTTSRASPSGKRMKSAIHDSFCCRENEAGPAQRAPARG
jgi:hypothetical protein